MSLRIVGAGLGRTGTLSLRTALERLLGAPCYHMLEVFAHPEHVPVWTGAAHGDAPDWRRFLGGYAATVDWPAASFWREIAAAFPEACVLLSTRSPSSWWESASSTIFPTVRAAEGPWRDMVHAVMRSRFTDAFDDQEAAIAAFERHNDEVRRSVPRERLLEWQPGDGWAPLCRALGVAVPDEPFPHVNTRETFPGGSRVQR